MYNLFYYFDIQNFDSKKIATVLSSFSEHYPANKLLENLWAETQSSLQMI